MPKMKRTIFQFMSLIFILHQRKRPAADSKLRINLKSLNVSQITDNVLRGVSCMEITKFFLERIEMFDDRGPNLNAVIMTNPNVSNEAQALDDFFNESSSLKGHLHCVPVLVKDIIPVKGLPTTYGLDVFSGSISKRDAFVVERVKEEGAVVLATANLKIFATSGFVDASETGGLEKNPYAPAYTVYGSSSGNAAGQAARYAVLGLGTDTSGSVLGPASATNLIGFRPVTTMYSNEGIMPVNPYSDTVAPLTFNVEDLGLLLDIFTLKEKPFYRNFVTDDVVKKNESTKVTVGIIAELFFGTFQFSSAGFLSSYSLHPEIAAICENALFHLWKMGYRLVNISGEVSYEIQAKVDDFARFFDCIPDHADEFLSKTPLDSPFGPIRSFQELFDTQMLPFPYKVLFRRLIRHRHQCPAANLKYLQARKELRLFFDNFFKQADILIYPCAQNLPWRNNESRWLLAHFQFLPGYLDYPALSLPIGFSLPRPDAPQGLPVSLIMFCKPEKVKSLLTVAHNYESEFGEQRLPYYTQNSPGNTVRYSSGYCSTYVVWCYFCLLLVFV